MSADEAETLAARALGAIASDEARLHRFLRISGLEASTIRAAAQSSAFLLGVLDYAAGNEGVLCIVAAELGEHPSVIMAARTALAPKIEQPPQPAPSGSILILCEACDRVEMRRRRDVMYAPPSAVRLRLPRCGPCGGGFDQPETWLDAQGREVG
ncbi:DUF3572 domain-containing protein [uncultured Enterovirga sp.]|uniref:DUF3572 domain-containing protein n=1 Tax=uncultured Enterovirga sp. TaxID=2026352 RepID=UPI0035CB6F26